MFVVFVCGVSLALVSNFMFQCILAEQGEGVMLAYFAFWCVAEIVFRLTMDQTIDCCGQGGGLDVV